MASLHLWTHETNRFGWTALLGKVTGSADVPPYAAAARASCLRSAVSASGYR